MFDCKSWCKFPIFLLIFLLPALASAAPNTDIVFVTQPPHPYDFATANSTFGNHRASLNSIPRGGDLWIRYANGTLRNLTAAAGYGRSGFQGASGIAVRDPAVHWSGEKILFSMVVGSPTNQYQQQQYRFQIYEMTGLAQGQTPVVTLVPGQPSQYNNIYPSYLSDDSIVFVSDRPLHGMSHTYPQLDEYESTPTNTGIFRLAGGKLSQLDHSPSGSFQPFVDSFGRVIFTRWDHLQRDQQNTPGSAYQAFNYSSEGVSSQPLDHSAEYFPEPRFANDPDRRSYETPHQFNHFFPWEMNQDGTRMETLNHIGRHELHDFIGRAFNNDPNIVEYFGQYPRVNTRAVLNTFQLSESPVVPGRYYFVDAPEFGSHASGQIAALDLPLGRSPSEDVVRFITHPETKNLTQNPGPNHAGLFRDPVRLSTGGLVAAYAGTTRPIVNTGSRAQPGSLYAFRLRLMNEGGQFATPGAHLTNGIHKTVSYWDPDVLVQYQNVQMWELQPRELRPRPRPNFLEMTLPDVEQSVFASRNLDIDKVRDYLEQFNLALVVTRDVTSRDALDKQQPFNVRVHGSSKQSIGAPGKVYDVSSLQFFEAALLRGYRVGGQILAGRRVLPMPFSASAALNIQSQDLAGSVAVAEDGSVAAFVPAGRALSWQLVAPDDTPVIRERYWVTFQPGEIRVCASCHGLSDADQLGRGEPKNTPLALFRLLEQFDFTKPPEITPPPEDAPEFRKRIRRLPRRGVFRRQRIRIESLSDEHADTVVELATSLGSGCTRTRKLRLRNGVAMAVVRSRPRLASVFVYHNSRLVLERSRRSVNRRNARACRMRIRSRF